jgi:hypothetical protein
MTEFITVSFKSFHRIFSVSHFLHVYLTENISVIHGAYLKFAAYVSKGGNLGFLHVQTLERGPPWCAPLFPDATEILSIQGSL